MPDHVDLILGSTLQADDTTRTRSGRGGSVQTAPVDHFHTFRINDDRQTLCTRPARYGDYI